MIFILTDGEDESKYETLNIIEENNNEFLVYEIGLGREFDEYLI